MNHTQVSHEEVETDHQGLIKGFHQKFIKEFHQGFIIKDSMRSCIKGFIDSFAKDFIRSFIRGSTKVLSNNDRRIVIVLPNFSNMIG